MLRGDCDVAPVLGEVHAASQRDQALVEVAVLGSAELRVQVRALVVLL